MIKGNGFFIPTEIGDFHPTLIGYYRPTLTTGYNRFVFMLSTSFYSSFIALSDHQGLRKQNAFAFVPHYLCHSDIIFVARIRRDADLCTVQLDPDPG